MTGLRPRTGYPMAHLPKPPERGLRFWLTVTVEGVLVLVVVVALVWLFAIYGAAQS